MKYPHLYQNVSPPLKIIRLLCNGLATDHRARNGSHLAFGHEQKTETGAYLGAIDAFEAF